MIENKKMVNMTTNWCKKQIRIESEIKEYFKCLQKKTMLTGHGFYQMLGDLFYANRNKDLNDIPIKIKSENSRASWTIDTSEYSLNPIAVLSGKKWDDFTNIMRYVYINRELLTDEEIERIINKYALSAYIEKESE